MKKIGPKLASVAIIATLALFGAGPISTPAKAMGCGYQVIGNDYWYNHCGPTKVLIKIDRVVGSEYTCVSPGQTPINRGFWRPTNAFYVGSC